MWSSLQDLIVHSDAAAPAAEAPRFGVPQAQQSNNVCRVIMEGLGRMGSIEPGEGVGGVMANVLSKHTHTETATVQH